MARDLPYNINTNTPEGDATMRALLREILDGLAMPTRLQLITDMTATGWIPPPKCFRVRVTRMVGPGCAGHGRNAPSNTQARGGGGAGEYRFNLWLSCTPGVPLTLQIGVPAAPTTSFPLPGSGTNTFISNGTITYTARAAPILSVGIAVNGNNGGGRIGAAAPGGVPGAPGTNGSDGQVGGETDRGGAGGGGGGNTAAAAGGNGGNSEDQAGAAGGVADGTRAAGGGGASSPFGPGGIGGSPGGVAAGVPGGNAPADSYGAAGGGASGGNVNQLGGSAPQGAIELEFEGEEDGVLV